MKILVTGGAGFVGGHVVQSLLSRGDEVVVVDNLNEYYDRRYKFHTLEALQRQADEIAKQTPKEGAGGNDVQQKREGILHFHIADATDGAAMEEIFAQYQGFDKVLHLAAQAGVRYSLEHPTEVSHINVGGTVCVLELCKRWSVPHLVMASSSSVYGTKSSPPFSETQSIANTPISPYAASKAACEVFGYSYAHLYKMAITALRFFTVYGPRGRPDMSCLKFIERIHRGEEIEKYGSGEAIREFTFITDIVEGVLGALNRPPSAGDQLVVNLGGGVTHTVNDLVSTIERCMGKNAKVKECACQPGDVPLTQACQKRAKERIGFEPKVSLEEGIKETVRWYQEYIKAPVADTSLLRLQYHGSLSDAVLRTTAGGIL